MLTSQINPNWSRKESLATSPTKIRKEIPNPFCALPASTTLDMIDVSEFKRIYIQIPQATLLEKIHKNSEYFLKFTNNGRKARVPFFSFITLPIIY